MDPQMAIERITEVENLTDNLEDDDANWLLDWGIGHVPKLIGDIKDEDAAGEKVNDLMAVMRKLNRISANRTAKSVDEMVADIKEFADLYSKAFGEIRKGGANDFKRAAREIAKQQPQEMMKYLMDFVARGSPVAWSVPGEPGREDKPIKV